MLLTAVVVVEAGSQRAERVAEVVGPRPHSGPPPEADAVPEVPRTASSPGIPAPRAGLAAAATAAVDALAAGTPGLTVAVAVLDRATGETAAGSAAGAPLYSASLVKILVAVDVLQRRRGGLAVHEDDIALIRRALGPSDDQAMNALWVRFDGYGAVGRVAGQLDLAETRVPQDPSQWGEAEMSASDVVRLYDHVLTGLPAADRELIMGAIGAAPPVATDGFDQTFGLLEPHGPPVTSKQGWMCCLDGRITLHSAGTLDTERRFVVALLSSQPRAAGYESARATLTAAADATRAALL
ncbi:MAG: serine hydrolase [Pseudonocardiaceae bacterium]